MTGLSIPCSGRSSTDCFRQSDGAVGRLTRLMGLVALLLFLFLLIRPVAGDCAQPAVAGGNYWMFALKEDGTVWAWGRNVYGLLGDDTTTDRWTPVQVKGPGGVGFLTDVKAIAAAAWAGLAALKEDGTVWDWGHNHFGQLGDDTTTDRWTPVQVKGPGGAGFLTDVKAVAGGSDHKAALKEDGTVWAWGYNYQGSLGDGTWISRYAPVQVLGPGGTGFLTGVIDITAGKDHTVALKDDGTVWAWGDNTNGKLGDNTTTDRNTPVQVKGPGGAGFLTEVIAVAAGKSTQWP